MNLKERLDKIDDLHGAFYKAGIDVQNPALEIEKIIKENDTEKVALLEASAIDLKNLSKIDFRKDIKEKLNNKSASLDEIQELLYELIT